MKTINAEVWTALKFDDRGLIPTIVQGLAMAFFFIPLVTLTLSGLSEDLTEQSVTRSEMVDQHPARGTCGSGAGTMPAVQPTR